MLATVTEPISVGLQAGDQLDVGTVDARFEVQ